MRSIITAAVISLIALTAHVREARAEFDYAAATPEGKLHLTFIGNCTLAISDGELTLMTDYPYRPGANGSMIYQFEATRPEGWVACLVTHSHKDHFHFATFLRRSWSLIGPSDVAGPLGGYDIYVVEDQVPIEYEGKFEVLPISTTHEGTIHFSYLVTWHGVRMYFSGDTEETSQALALQDLDIAFVNPLLLEHLKENGSRIDTDRLVVYHHHLDDEIVDYADRVVPTQGQTFDIDFRETEAASP
jgi:hypothetical protein